MLITCGMCQVHTPPPPPPSPGGHENSTLGVVGVPLDLKAVWVGVSMGTRVTSLPNNYP